jgi:enediyne biosynthesis protein E4
MTSLTKSLATINGLLSRRKFLGLLASASASAACPPIFAASAEIFEVTSPRKTGITWVHDNARSQTRFLPETIGPGCAFLDYDNDGWMDIYLVNSGPSDFYHPLGQPPRNALYKNNRDGTFTDVTSKAGVGGGNFGMGVAVGDYDADGFPDMYVTGYGRNILYHNNGDGTFTDVTEIAGVADPNWSTSAVWFDYDNDGRLDLFVCNFVEYGGEGNTTCGKNRFGKSFYCIPRVFKGRPSALFHNNGDGTFTEVGHNTAIGKILGKAFGVVATDINNDGWMDLFVANDTVSNFLFANRGNGTFEEIAFTAGVAYSESGTARSGMGVDSADYDNDGRMDLFVANVDKEQFSLYHNDGRELFTDRALETGIGQTTALLSGWGLKFFDYDNDGNLDLILANGHPDDMVDEYHTHVTYREPLLLFHNTGTGLVNVSEQGGPAFKKLWPARGLAIGDFDNDGGSDVLIGNSGEPPLLLRNLVGRKNNWLGIKLIGRKCNIDAVGARITWSFSGITRSRLKTGGGSFLSSHDPRVILGVGRARKIDWLEVKWPLPSGKVERFIEVPLNRYITISEGKGQWE